eukprot:54910-Eustigmatos_ZCMA.PRE.1
MDTPGRNDSPGRPAHHDREVSEYYQCHNPLSTRADHSFHPAGPLASMTHVSPHQVLCPTCHFKLT